jgi:hypothetical protein
MVKIKRCKRKIKRKSEKIFTNAILDWTLITCSPAIASKKGLLKVQYTGGERGFGSGL